MSETGYAEGRNVAIEYRWAEDQRSAAGPGRRSSAPPGGRDRHSRKAPSLAAKAVTTTLPVVFMAAATRSSRTGRQPEPARRQCHRRRHVEHGMGPKRLQLLHELMPAATTSPCSGPDQRGGRDPIERAAGGGPHSGLQVRIANRAPDAISRQLLSLKQAEMGGLVIGSNSFFFTHSQQLAALTARHAIPTISNTARSSRPAD